MVRIEKFEVRGVAFYIVGPTGRLNECPASIITQRIDRGYELSEVNRGIGIELIDLDFSDGSREHVSDVPPGEGKREQAQYQKSFHYLIDLY